MLTLIPTRVLFTRCDVLLLSFGSVFFVSGILALVLVPALVFASGCGFWVLVLVDIKVCFRFCSIGFGFGSDCKSVL